MLSMLYVFFVRFSFNLTYRTHENLVRLQLMLTRSIEYVILHILYSAELSVLSVPVHLPGRDVCL